VSTAGELDVGELDNVSHEVEGYRACLAGAFAYHQSIVSRS
jgi:hypothetical protein